MAVKQGYPYRIEITPENESVIEYLVTHENVFQEGNKVYSYLTQEDFNNHMGTTAKNWKCPSTEIEGKYDESYYREYHGIQQNPENT